MTTVKNALREMMEPNVPNNKIIFQNMLQLKIRVLEAKPYSNQNLYPEN